MCHLKIVISCYNIRYGVFNKYNNNNHIANGPLLCAAWQGGMDGMDGMDASPCMSACAGAMCVPYAIDNDEKSKVFNDELGQFLYNLSHDLFDL